MAKTWSASIVGQVRIRTVNSRCIRPVKPTIGVLPIDPTIPHSPNSMNPTRPTTARNDADVGRIRLCTEVDSPILPRRAKLAESEESRSVRARPWFDSLQSPSGFSSYPFNPENFTTKWHPSPHKNNIRNGLSTKPVSPVTAAYGA